jgi:hypothetical protein
MGLTTSLCQVWRSSTRADYGISLRIALGQFYGPGDTIDHEHTFRILHEERVLHEESGPVNRCNEILASPARATERTTLQKAPIPLGRNGSLAIRFRYP